MLYEGGLALARVGWSICCYKYGTVLEEEEGRRRLLWLRNCVSMIGAERGVSPLGTGIWEGILYSCVGREFPGACSHHHRVNRYNTL